MIRRDIRLANGGPGWMLISQVEHARISGELASHCTAALNAHLRVRAEVLAAITLHDDGWADWERSPRLDASLGRPLSFMEMDHRQSMTIWSRSIGAAEKLGPLAAWMVAGHFARLLQQSPTAAQSSEGRQWLANVASRRAAWLAAWREADPSHHTPGLAEATLQWLRAFDEASLWLCSTSRSGGRFGSSPDGSYQAGRGTPVAMAFRVVGDGVDAGSEQGMATASPWLFDQRAIDLAVSGRIVPASRFQGLAEMLAAGEPGILRWRLASAEE